MVSENTIETFAGFIRGLRIKARKSMGQIARELDISVVYYSEVEAGKKPSFPVGKFDYSKLAESLNIAEKKLIQIAEADREKRSIVKMFGCDNEYAEVAVAFGRRLSNKELTEEQLNKIRKILSEGQ